MVTWRGLDWAKAGGALALSASVLGTSGVVPALADTAADALMSQGIYWRARNRPDLAIDALSRLLRADPNRVDALFQIAMAEAQSGHSADATAHLAKLQQVAPADPRINEVRLAIKAGTGTPPEIAAARSEAISNPDKAIQTYRQAFNGGPPPDQYALEYYSTLGGTNNPQNTDESRRGLEALIRATGGEPRARFALANSLINREATRRDGIQQLAQLSDDALVGKAAAERWHQGVVWLGPNPRDRDLMRAYLAKFPSDEAVRTELDAADHPPAGPGADPTARARIAAFGALNGGNLDAAAAEFERTLRARPGDPDSLGGLGLVRLRQERFVEARDLLARAGGARSRYAAAYASAAFWADMAQARQAIAAGNNAQGIALARQALTHPNPEQSFAELLLGDTLASSGDLPGAEQYYRAVLARDPQNADALVGLFGVLTRENRPADATQLLARLNQVDRARVPGATRVQGEVLRIQAQAADRAGQYAQAGALYGQALQADPSSPFLRLDYARFLARQGNVTQANALVAGLTAPSLPTTGRLATTRPADVFYAAALYYNDQNRPTDALAMLGRIPQTDRTAEVNALYDRLATSQYTDRAVQIARAGNVLQAEQLLAQVRAQGPLTLDRSQLIAQAYIDIGDQGNALQVAQEGLARAPQAPPGALLQYVGILLATEQPAAAAALIARLDATPNLTAAQHRDLARVHADLITDRAAQAAGYVDIPGAYTLVVTELTKYPGDAALTLSLARIYAAAGRPEDALNLYDRVLAADPRNIDAIRGAVGAAIDAKDTGRAYDLVDQGIEYYPDNARLYYLKSQVAQSNGDRLRAVNALKEARRLLQASEPPASYAAPVYGFSSGRPAYQLPPVPPAGPPRSLAPAAGTPGRQAALDTIVVDASAISLTAARLSPDEAPRLVDGQDLPATAATSSPSSPVAQFPAAPVDRPPVQVAQLMPVPMAQAMPVQIAQAQIVQAAPVQLAEMGAASMISVQMAPRVPMQAAPTEALPMQALPMQGSPRQQLPVQLAQMAPVQMAQMQVGPGQYVQVPMQMPMQQMPMQMAQAPMMVPMQMAQGYPVPQGYQMVYAPPGYAMQQPMMMAPMYQPAPMYQQPYPVQGYGMPMYAPQPNAGRPLFQSTGQPVYMSSGGQALPPVPPAGMMMTAQAPVGQSIPGQPVPPSPITNSPAVPSQALAPLPANQPMPGDPFFTQNPQNGPAQNTAVGQAYQSAPVYQQAPVYQPPVIAAPAYQQVPVYQPPAYQAPRIQSRVYQPVPAYQAPAYQAPAYQPPAYQQVPLSQAPARPLFTTPTPLAQSPAPSMQQPNSLTYASPGAPYATAPIAPYVPASPFAAQPPMASLTSQPGFDPLQADIDRSLAQLRGETVPYLKGGIGGDYRDGEDGLSRLFSVTAPVSVTFNPFYLGEVTFGIAPTYASAGSLAGDTATLRRFGSNSLIPLGTPIPSPRSQDASGVGVNLAYANGPVGVDIGTTPLGFHQLNVTGGASYAPKFIDNTMTLRLEAQRRPIVDSLLSYAGVRDPRTGIGWGGVVRTGGRVELDYDDGDFGAYGGGGFYTLNGANVANNTEGEGTVGAFFRPLRRNNYALKTGINLSYVAYDKNLRYFTLGQGGYFSPQSYGAISFPVEFDGRKGKFTYLAGAALGIQAFSEDASRVFPNRADLQTVLNNAAASDPTLMTNYSSRSSTALLANFRLQGEYQIRPSLVVGASGTFNNSRDYNEASVLFYFKQLLGGSSSASSQSTASVLDGNDGVFSMVRNNN